LKFSTPLGVVDFKTALAGLDEKFMPGGL